MAGFQRSIYCVTALLIVFVVIQEAAGLCKSNEITAHYASTRSASTWDYCEKMIYFPITTTVRWHSDDPTFPLDFFTGLFRFTFKPFALGKTSFRTKSDDGVQVWINDQLVINQGGSGFFENRYDYNFVTLDPVSIVVLYTEGQFNAGLEFTWLNNGVWTPYFFDNIPCDGINNGLATKWWSTPSISGPPSFVTCEFSPDFFLQENGNISPHAEIPGFPRENYAAQFDGCFFAPKSGSYLFRVDLNNDDTYKLVLDGNTVLNANVPPIRTATVSLTSGAHPMTVQYTTRPTVGLAVLSMSINSAPSVVLGPDYFLGTLQIKSVCPDISTEVVLGERLSPPIDFGTLFYSCGPLTTSTSVPNLSTFPVGVHTVSARATASNGNSASCTFRVIVTNCGVSCKAQTVHRLIKGVNQLDHGDLLTVQPSSQCRISLDRQSVGCSDANRAVPVVVTGPLNSCTTQVYVKDTPFSDCDNSQVSQELKKDQLNSFDV